MRGMLALACVLVGLGFGRGTPAQPGGGEDQPRSVRARDFDVLPDTGEDAGSALGALIKRTVEAAGPARIVLETGTYYLDGKDASEAALVIEKAKDLVLCGEGNGTSLIVRNPGIGAILVSGGNGVWVENLCIDYDPLPFSQGNVLIVNTGETWFDFVIEPGYPLLSEPWFSNAPARRWGMVFDRSKPERKAGASDYIYIDSWERIGDRSWRMYPSQTHKDRLSDLRLGDRFVQLAPRGKGGAVFFQNCLGGGVRGVNVYASQSVAVGANKCEGLTVQDLAVIRKPGTDRLLSTNADGVHARANRQGPVIENCRFESTADDGVSIYGRPNTVKAFISDVAFRTDDAEVIEVGDRLVIIDPVAGRFKGEAIAALVSRTPDQEYRVTTDRPVSGVRAGDAGLRVYNLSRCSADFVVRNNAFHHQRRHGITIRTPKGLIENNEVTDAGGYGIVAANDTQWPEGVVPGALTIRNNQIRNVGQSRWYGIERNSAAIQIMALAQGGHPAEDRLLDGVVMGKNIIENPPGAAVYIGSARNVALNTVSISYSGDRKPPRKTAAIIIENAAFVRMKHIKVDSAQPNVRAGILILDTVDKGVDGVTVEDIQISGPITMDTILDERE